ncbi:MAG: hypothetical protein WCX46_02325 [Candidatus Paceibacterota bacterium]
MLNLKNIKYVNKKTVLILVALLIFVSGLGVYYFIKYRQLTRDPNAIAKKETAELVSTVSKLIMLPEGESPAVATVQDKEKLSSEPFFANALNGDKVLIYYAAKKAFLYRPDTNKVIEAAPLSTQNTETVSKPAISTTKTKN